MEYIEEIVKFLDAYKIALIGFFYIISIALKKYYQYKCKLLEIEPKPPIDYVDELISEYECEDENGVSFFKRHYKRTYNNGGVEYHTSED